MGLIVPTANISSERVNDELSQQSGSTPTGRSDELLAISPDEMAPDTDRQIRADTQTRRRGHIATGERPEGEREILCRRATMKNDLKLGRLNSELERGDNFK